MAGDRMERLLVGGNVVDQIAALERRVGALERRAGGTVTRSLVDGWRRSNVAASLSGSVVDRFGNGVDAGLMLPVEMTVRGLYVWLNEARTGGTLAAGVFVDGTATSLAVEVNEGETRGGFYRGGVVVPAGGVVTVRLTSSGDWGPTTADLWAGLLVEV